MLPGAICCDGETLKYCENNQLYEVDCATQGPKCGWDPNGSYYNCGTGGSADPSGTHPKQCAGADAAVPDLPQPDLPQPDLAAPDAPWLPDLQVQVDQPASQPDVARTDGGGGDGGEDGGCGCRVASAPGQPALPLLLGLALGLVLARRARRRRWRRPTRRASGWVWRYCDRR